MRAGLFLLVGLVAVAGCGTETKANGEVPAVVVEKVPPPDFDRLASISGAPRLINEDREVHVGQDLADAEGLVPRPKRAAEFRDLPPGFGAGFRSRGWEADGEAYGVISYGGKVVAAVHSITEADETRLSAVLRRYRTASEMAPDIEGESARYWFNTSGAIHLMVCAVREKDALYVTEAVGEERAMKALRMHPLQAANDVRKADKGPVTAVSPE